MITAYDVFDLKPEASELEIRQAFRRRVRLFHPDTNRLADVKYFMELKKAYEILMDEKSRELVAMRPLFSEALLFCPQELSGELGQMLANLNSVQSVVNESAL